MNLLFGKSSLLTNASPPLALVCHSQVRLYNVFLDALMNEPASPSGDLEGDGLDFVRGLYMPEEAIELWPEFDLGTCVRPLFISYINNTSYFVPLFPDVFFLCIIMYVTLYFTVQYCTCSRACTWSASLDIPLFTASLLTCPKILIRYSFYMQWWQNDLARGDIRGVCAQIDRHEGLGRGITHGSRRP